MKKRIVMATAIAAAFALTACSVVEQSPEELLLNSRAKSIDVTFTVGEYETKTAFGPFSETQKNYATYWTAHDQSIAVSLNLAEPVEAQLIRSTDAEKAGRAAFTGTFENTGAPYKFYAISPVSAINTLSESRDSWAVNIPTVQTPTEDGLSCDEDAMLLYAVSDEMTEMPADPVELPFKHLTSYIRLALKGLDSVLQANDADEATVKSVDLIFSVPVAGEWYIDAATGALTEKEASHTITVKPNITDLSKATDIWVALAPCVLDGATLKVAVNTTLGTISRTVTFGTRTYVAGAVNKISMDMTKENEFEPYGVETETTAYVLVTDVTTIAANDVVIFADGPVPSYAMTSTAVASKGLKAVAINTETGFTYDETNHYIFLPEGSEVMPLTVSSKSGSSSNPTVRFSYNGKYLATSGSGTSRYPSLGTSAQSYTMYPFDGGDIALYFSARSGWSTYYFSLYCDGSNFTFYATTQSSVAPLALFKKQTVTVINGFDPDDDPVFLYNEYGAYLKKGGNTVHTPKVSQLSREYAGNALTFSIMFPDDNKLYEFGGIPTNVAKGDMFTLTLTKVAGRRHTVLGTFDVTVMKEDGAKLWLSDRNGNGFIVKR